MIVYVCKFISWIVFHYRDKLYIFDKDLNVSEGGVYTWQTEVGVSCPSQVSADTSLHVYRFEFAPLIWTVMVSMYDPIISDAIYNIVILST